LAKVDSTGFGGAQVDRMLGWVVVERQQFVEVIGDLGNRLGGLGAVVGGERVRGGCGVLAVLGVPEAVTSACSAAASICRAPSRTTSWSSDPPAAPVVFSCDASASWTILSVGRTFPSRRANADPDQNMQWASILLGRCARFTSHRRGPSTGFDHCSCLAPGNSVGTGPAVAHEVGRSAGWLTWAWPSPRKRSRRSATTTTRQAVQGPAPRRFVLSPTRHQRPTQDSWVGRRSVIPRAGLPHYSPRPPLAPSPCPTPSRPSPPATAPTKTP
jgi:hypothetical protein